MNNNLMTEKEIRAAIRPLHVQPGGTFNLLPDCYDIQPGDLFVQQQQDVSYPGNIFAVLRPAKEAQGDLLKRLNPLDRTHGGALKICYSYHQIQTGDLLIHRKGQPENPCELLAILSPV